MTPLLPGYGPQMSQTELVKISTYVEREFGIKMPRLKRHLLEGRLAKRLAACGIPSYGEYFEHITTSPAGRDEFLRFVNLVSTHETSFFREAKHFQLLVETVLPAWCRQKRRKSIRILSAACSTGEEAYTLVMLTNQAILDSRRTDLTFTVEGLDLSSEAISVATRGVYAETRTTAIPPDLRHRYLMRSKDLKRGLYRIVPGLRRCMEFHTGNLLYSNALHANRYDLIFCRNVLIYFTPNVQERVE